MWLYSRQERFCTNRFINRYFQYSLHHIRAAAVPLAALTAWQSLFNKSLYGRCGVVEIAAGIGVALKPRIFAYVVAAWLVAIIVNLLILPGYFDVALRDLGLALGALALGRLSQKYDRPWRRN